ncbi:16S rRNA (uracil(1498)-N(3))-methyltransferase [Pacificimonas flava]|uniref:Ribosomal RNA small subunit methyltransferase E n=1 Tax=Pacificimonas flava TaxID=1234595 RepID=M2T7G5_9SPHN|nr:16S rRNA (uracil(1498)-N(3))-methyltransferase [Pacificimonas flava]EMD82464.1 Ribosomal RNA small subunit methyltransferase E [Pacificimonas flava]MBB5281296.1 16S rRNA (uracil1498-N3)-methyltransferase [Pacificimonas flava]
MSSGRTPRLFVDEELKAGVATALGPDAARYLGSVLRLGAGADVLLFDDRTGEWRAPIVEIGKRGAVLRPAERTRARERVPDLWLCAAPIKRARFEWMAEKACELGAARFVPVVTAHTEVRGVKAERLRAHMIEAAEQCERTAIPALGEMQALKVLLRDWPEGRALIFCDEEAGGEPALDAMPGEPAAILIGPEGGFNADERARIAAHPAAVRVSLGPRILRADTAAAAALSLWQAARGDWR